MSLGWPCGCTCVRCLIYSIKRLHTLREPIIILLELISTNCFHLWKGELNRWWWGRTFTWHHIVAMSCHPLRNDNDDDDDEEGISFALEQNRDKAFDNFGKKRNEMMNVYDAWRCLLGQRMSSLLYGFWASCLVDSFLNGTTRTISTKGRKNPNISCRAMTFTTHFVSKWARRGCYEMGGRSSGTSEFCMMDTLVSQDHITEFHWFALVEQMKNPLWKMSTE